MRMNHELMTDSIRDLIESYNSMVEEYSTARGRMRDIRFRNNDRASDGSFFHSEEEREHNEDEYTRLSRRVADLSVLVPIVREHLLSETYDAVIGDIVDILSNFNGKAFGPKTRETIAAHILNRTGCSVYFNMTFKYYDSDVKQCDSISVYPDFTICATSPVSNLSFDIIVKQ